MSTSGIEKHTLERRITGKNEFSEFLARRMVVVGRFLMTKKNV